MLSFTELKLSEPLLRALEEAGYHTPTPIQQQAIPAVLAGKDVMGCAQTGTGKTAAFLLPIVQQLLDRPPVSKADKKALRVLVLAPTRELAIQIGENAGILTRFVPLTSMVVFGGVSVNNQIEQIRKHPPQILIATPGRLLDLVGQKVLSLKEVQFLVLDEADRMLEMGFIHDIRKVLQLLPPRRQTLMFSATMPDNIRTLANNILHHPVSVEVSPVSSTVVRIEQKIYPVEKANKVKLLVHLIKKFNPLNMIVFSRTKHGADRIVRSLEKERIFAAAIHSNKSQNARVNALQHFKDGKIKVLVATDIASRGIDIQGLEYVVNYDIPADPEAYVHRIGRTGRAGADGKAFTFCAEDEWDLLQKINKLTKQEIPLETQHPYVIALEAPVVPEPVMKAPQKTGKRKPDRRRSRR